MARCLAPDTWQMQLLSHIYWAQQRTPQAPQGHTHCAWEQSDKTGCGWQVGSDKMLEYCLVPLGGCDWLVWIIPVWQGNGIHSPGVSGELAWSWWGRDVCLGDLSMGAQWGGEHLVRPCVVHLLSLDIRQHVILRLPFLGLIPHGTNGNTESFKINKSLKDVKYPLVGILGLKSAIAKIRKHWMDWIAEQGW